MINTVKILSKEIKSQGQFNRIRWHSPSMLFQTGTVFSIFLASFIQVSFTNQRQMKQNNCTVLIQPSTASFRITINLALVPGSSITVFYDSKTVKRQVGVKKRAITAIRKKSAKIKSVLIPNLNKWFEQEKLQNCCKRVSWSKYWLDFQMTLEGLLWQKEKWTKHAAPIEVAKIILEKWCFTGREHVWERKKNRKWN